ncbi:MAG: hypothetical protein GYA35_05570, partial [Thermoanaerobaculaceae bacterium]|nr:hypothetical protein [Thermoanaerobaculaceae bacterium]
NPARIVIEITDSGCNTATYLSDYTYAINKPPTFNVIWESGCNTPPVGAGCPSNSEWIVCGYLNFTVNAHAYFYNEVPNSTFPNDDITQIAYKIDDGSWVLYPVFPPYDGAYQNYSQFISFDTNFLSDGFHTLYLRVTDDLGLQTLKDTSGIDSWTFNVFNLGSNPQLTSPPSGDVYRTSSIPVIAHLNNEVSTYPTQQVDFYLDSDPYNPLPNGTLIGSSTVKLPNNNFSISWDATSTPLGSHTITCWAYYYGCCSAYSRSDTISINLIEPSTPPPEIAVGNSYSEALIFSEDKQTISWPGEATATGYKLFRGTLNDLPNLQNDNIDSCTRYFGTNTSVDLSSDDPSATAGNLYWYLVVGYNAVGDGPAGNSRIVNSQGICSGGAGNSNPWAGVHSLLPKSMYWSASCAYNGKIYVFGGNENDGEVNTTYIYDIATDTWTQGANMPTGRYICTAVEVGGKIYVMGGRQLTASTNPVNVNECYDPATDTWTTKAAMPNAIRGHSAVGANGKIYVMGGNTGAYTDVVNIYDPSSNAWSSGPKLPAKVAYGGAVYSSSKNAIYYVGGVKSSATSSSNFVGKIFKLDLSTNSWDSGTEMTYKTAYFGIAANGDGSKIYIVGGMYWNSSANDEYSFPGIQV